MILRTLFISSNMLIRTFSKCNEKVKIELFKSHIFKLFLRIVNLQSIYSKISVAYNDVFRKTSKTTTTVECHMFTTNNVLNFEALIRSKVISFIERFDRDE